MALNEYEVGATVLLETTITNEYGVLVNPTTISGMIQSPSNVITYYTVTSAGVGQFWFKYTITEEGEYTYAFITETPESNLYTHDSGFFVAIAYESNDLDYLIPQLRNHLGDRDEMVYSTDFLRQQLFAAFKALIPRWRYKYTLDANNIIGRNTTVPLFEYESPPIIQPFDERPIILMASIIINNGSLQTKAAGFGIGSWRDDEISYSNIASKDVLERAISRDQAELDTLLPSRSQKLAHTYKQSLVGFTSAVLNIYEGNETDPE